MIGKKRFEAQGSTCSISSCTSHRAFSLIELLVAILLGSVVMGAIYSVYRVQTRSMKVQENRMEAQEYARSVIDLMVREIRNTGYAPITGTTCQGIMAAEAKKIQFLNDSNADTDCVDLDEDVTYEFVTTGCAAGMGNITRKEGTNAPVELTDCNVSDAPIFTYFPKDCPNNFSTPVETPPGLPSCPGTPGGNAGTLAAVQRVTVAVTIQSKNPDPDFGAGQLTATMTSNVDLRNIGLPP
jgi:prepilin-type N-terminal cleavage/methylation domain-containing protein